MPRGKSRSCAVQGQHVEGQEVASRQQQWDMPARLPLPQYPDRYPNKLTILRQPTWTGVYRTARCKAAQSSSIQEADGRVGAILRHPAVCENVPWGTRRRPKQKQANQSMTKASTKQRHGNPTLGSCHGSAKNDEKTACQCRGRGGS